MCARRAWLFLFCFLFLSLRLVLHVHAAAKRNSVSNYKSSRYRESPPAYLLTALRLLIILFSLFLSPFFPSRPSVAGQHTHTTYGSSFIDVYTLRSPKETKTKSAHSFCNIKTHQIDAELRKNMRTPVDQPPHLNELRKEERGPSSLQTPLLLMSIVVIYLSIYIFFSTLFFFGGKLTPSSNAAKVKTFFFFWWPIDNCAGDKTRECARFIFFFADPKFLPLCRALKDQHFPEKKGKKKMPHNQVFFLPDGSLVSSVSAVAADSN